MAETAESLFYNFYRPEMRGQLSIPNLHIPRKLRKTTRQFPYRVTYNTAFEDVIHECAKEGGRGRKTTWINGPIRTAFIALHKDGKAHSIECWDDDKLVGGLYGLSIGRVFCGESMFSRATDASKIALIHLCARLWKAGYTVLDTQFINDHLLQFGAYEIPQADYEALIETEMCRRTDFTLRSKFPDLREDRMVLDYLEFLTS